MKSNEFGYVRVSSKNQNELRQMIAMRSVGIKESDIFIDKQSGKNFKRPQYHKLMKKVKPGDVVYIKSIDRLGRDYEEVIRQWGILTKERDVDIVVLDFPLLDTRNKINGLTGKFIADMALQILSYVAQIERENIKQRQMEGIRGAKENGVKFGRPLKQIPDNFTKIFRDWLDGEISQNKASQLLGVDRKTFKKWCEKQKV